VPKGTLFGVFLFMGLTSIAGNQLFERMILWFYFNPRTHPRLPYVTRIQTRRMHLFTAIEFICLAILYALKAEKQTATVFPFFIGTLVFVRFGLDKFFSKDELDILDAEEDLAPEPWFDDAEDPKNPKEQICSI